MLLILSIFVLLARLSNQDLSVKNVIPQAEQEEEEEAFLGSNLNEILMSE